MCARLSHTLEPLTNLMSSKGNYKWADVEHKVFENINRIVACNTLLAYTGLNK